MSGAHASCPNCAELLRELEESSDKYHDLDAMTSWAYAYGFADGMKAARDVAVRAAAEIKPRMPRDVGGGIAYRPELVGSVREWIEAHHMSDDDARRPGRMFAVPAESEGE